LRSTTGSSDGKGWSRSKERSWARRFNERAMKLERCVGGGLAMALLVVCFGV
jgi:hypothetical protein